MIDDTVLLEISHSHECVFQLWPFWDFRFPSQISYYTVHKHFPFWFNPLTNKCSCLAGLISNPPSLHPLSCLAMHVSYLPPFMNVPVAGGVENSGFAQIGVLICFENKMVFISGFVLVLLCSCICSLYVSFRRDYRSPSFVTKDFQFSLLDDIITRSGNQEDLLIRKWKMEEFCHFGCKVFHGCSQERWCQWWSNNPQQLSILSYGVIPFN